MNTEVNKSIDIYEEQCLVLGLGLNNKLNLSIIRDII